MKKVESLKEVIEFNSSFKTAINLYLSLNKPEKILGYIPTKSSVNFIGEYLKAVDENKEQATLLVGPYGKGKSHLLLVLLAILSMSREQNYDVLETLVNRVSEVDEVGTEIAALIKKIWKKKPFLPVLITDTTGDLNQAFLYGLNEALKREKLTDISPDTYYSIAINRIFDWKDNYPDTYSAFNKELEQNGLNVDELVGELKLCSRNALDQFINIYPKVTAGSAFNPMAVSDVLPLYKNVSEKLVEEYGYSGIYIVFDEFSKFIESQDGTATGANMKLLQDICELATESQHAQIFFTMVAHKSIKEYGKYLSADIINSFTGIEGRIIEKLFITSSKNNYELIKNAIGKKISKWDTIDRIEKYVGKKALDDYHQLPAFRTKFPVKEFENIILKGCYPLNPIAAYLLLNVSEKVAQNERTLFTFISNDEPNSMARFVEEATLDDEWTIGADLIYDYFEALFKKEVSNEFVHNIWLSAEYVLDKCITEEQKKIAKALAIVLIVNKEDEIPATKNYLKLCVKLTEPDVAFDELENGLQLISEKRATGTYAFRTRAGAELKSEIKKQRELKGDNVNYAKVLSDVTGRYYVVPRKYNTEHSMTRYFTNEFMHVDDFLNISSAKALLSDIDGDGKVITLFSFTGIKQELVKKHVEDLGENRLVVVCPKKGLKAQKQLKDIEILQELRCNQNFTTSNEILKRELPLLLDDLSAELNQIIAMTYEEDTDTRVLYFDGEKVKNAKSGNEENAVNDCCENIYFKSAIINNEMVNRRTITTGQTKKARMNVIQSIIENSCNEEFYKGSNQEATIYRSLFTVTNLVTDGEPQMELKEIIAEVNNYIDSCSDKKVSLKPLMDKLTGAPYGMRMGVIPMYFAYVLSNRREDIIVYFSDKEVQITSEIIVNMCEQAEDYALYVSKADLEKEKYISELNELFGVEDNRNLSANRIKDIVICMQRWFRALAQSSRNLIDVESYIDDENIIDAMKSIKKAMQKMEFNPFEILFVDFPNDFGTKSLKDTAKVIDECRTFYEDYFDWLKVQVANVIYKVWGGKKRKNLYHTLTEWYEKQSNRSKQGLYAGRITNFMSCVSSLEVSNDPEVVEKIVKAVTDVYMENWNSGALDDFEEALITIKQEIEAINEDASNGEMELIFTDHNGNEIKKNYNYADESTGSVLRNILEDTLEEYDDLSVNDRVSILLEMIEKIIR